MSSDGVTTEEVFLSVQHCLCCRDMRHTMQKGFIVLLIIWNSSSLASGNKNFLLGCEAVIPCQQDTSNSDSFKWFYKNDQRSDRIQIFFKQKTGLELHQQDFRSRMRVLGNRSLVINQLTEDDEGDYWCENCLHDNCQNERPTVTSVKTEILKETHETFNVAAGCSFTHACPGELTNLKWTFEASSATALKNLEQVPESRFVTSNKSIQIVNIKRADAGKYTCWTKACDGYWQKLLTINLCVITEHHSEDSSIYCAGMHDFSNIEPNSTLNVETLDGYTTVSSTHGTSSTLNPTTGISAEPEYLIPLIYGTSAAIICLILMTLFICYLKPRSRAAFPVHIYCCSLNSRVEEEASVVYSSVIIRRPAKTTNNEMTQNENYCVYSEINCREDVSN